MTHKSSVLAAILLSLVTTASCDSIGDNVPQKREIRVRLALSQLGKALNVYHEKHQSFPITLEDAASLLDDSNQKKLNDIRSFCTVEYDYVSSTESPKIVARLGNLDLVLDSDMASIETVKKYIPLRK